MGENDCRQDVPEISVSFENCMYTNVGGQKDRDTTRVVFSKQTNYTCSDTLTVIFDLNKRTFVGYVSIKI